MHAPVSVSHRRHCLSLLAVITLLQGLTLAHFRAQLEDLPEDIAHVRAQLEHPRDTSMGYFGLYGGQSKFKLSGKRQGKLKLSGNGNEGKPLPWCPAG